METQSKAASCSSVKSGAQPVYAAYPQWHVVGYYPQQMPPQGSHKSHGERHKSQQGGQLVAHYLPPPDLPGAAFLPLYCQKCQKKIQKKVKKMAKNGFILPPPPAWLPLHEYVEHYARYCFGGQPHQTATFSLSDRSSSDSVYGSILTHGSSEPITPVSSRVERPPAPIPPGSAQSSPFLPISSSGEK